MHVHASDSQLTESCSAKFFVKNNGDTVIQNRGDLSDRDLLRIQKFIKENYLIMFEKWAEYSKKGFYGDND